MRSFILSLFLIPVLFATSLNTTVPPLDLSKVRLIAWFKVPSISLSDVVAAFDEYNWHGNYVEGWVTCCTIKTHCGYDGYGNPVHYYVIYRLPVRVRSDGLILVWIPKGMNLRAFVETYRGMNIIEYVIKNVLDAAHISTPIKGFVHYYFTEYPDADTIVVLDCHAKYVIPSTVKPLGGLVEFSNPCGTKKFSGTVDGSKIEYTIYDVDYIPRYKDYYLASYLPEIPLGKLFANWAFPDKQHTINLPSYGLCRIIMFLKTK